MSTQQTQTRDTDTQWYLHEADEVISEEKSSPEGLSAEEAKKRLERYGKNKLPTKKAPSVFQVILRQLKSPLIYILAVAGVLSLIVGEITDAVFIFVVVVINATIGTIQEFKAEKSAEKLQKMIEARARVRRGGQEVEIDAAEVVPGDIVLLQSGQRVAADGRILTHKNLGVDESILTGESTTVQKQAEPIGEEDLETSEQVNMVFAGTSVISGRAEVVIVRTGMETQLGQISRAVTETETEKLPLVRRMDKFVKQLSIAILGAVILLGVVVLIRGVPLVEVFLMAVALAVSAIPAGLPVAMTVALAVGVNRMAKRRAIIRKLPAVEGLGSCTYIASDKTGTLTSNTQTARKIALAQGSGFTYMEVSGQGYSGEGELRTGGERSPSEKEMKRAMALARAGVLANEGTLKKREGEWYREGDPIDIALLALAYKAGGNPARIRDELKVAATIPYESSRKYAAAFYRDRQGGARVAVKGALEKVLSFSKWVPDGDGRAEINRERIQKAERDLADQGFRVLALATGEGQPPPEESDEEFSDKDLPPLTFLGLVGFIDPLRPEVKDAVAECRKAGVKVGMITGDHPRTALAIAKDLGIAESQEELAAGKELDKLKEEGEEVFQDKVKKTSVFARINPLQKVEIVESLVDSGHFVAVTGDGVNDAPALRRANLGIAMGSGNDVAKDTGAVIITDDNFASIVAGIEEGRRAYSNLRKVIYLLISTGAAEVVLFTLAVIFGMSIPLVAVQLLWLNLVTNGIQHVGLAFESREPGLMDRKPRDPQEGVFNRRMIEEVSVAGLTMSLVGFGVWWWLRTNNASLGDARNLLLLLFVMFENFHVFNCRSEYVSAFRMPLQKNLILLFGVIGAFGIHLASLYIPVLQEILQTNPVTLTQFGVLFLLASSVLIASEVFKLVRRRRD